MRPLLLAALIAPSAALAVDAPPFSPDRKVVLVPEALDFRTAAVSEAVGQVERDVYVVVFGEVADGRTDLALESETEEAIEAVWTGWSRDVAFDPQASVLVVLALDEREVRIRYGSRWDAELGLAREGALWVIDDHFLPKAQTGDLDGALADLVRGADAAIPKLQAEKQALAEKEARWAAEQAERERLAAEEEAAREKLRAERAEARQRALRVGGPLAALLGLLGVGGVGVTLVRRPVRYARLGFEAEVEDWREKLARAEATFAGLRIDTEVRDQVVELRLKGPKTKALLQKIATLLDEIQVGLEGLKRHVDAVVAKVGRPGPFDAKAWLAGIDALSEPFTVDTGEVTHRLFDQPTRTIEVDPNAFVSTLEARWTEARTGWERLLDAVQASLRAARDDLSTGDLQAMESKLDAAGISRLWVARHPLRSEPDRVWQQLDALRKADPVAYLDELEALLAAEDAIGDAVVAVIEDATTARDARAKAEAVRIDDLATTIRDPSRDPATALGRATALHAELEELLSRGGDPGRVDAKTAETVAAWNDVAQRRSELRTAVGTASERVAEARERQERLTTTLASARARIAHMLGDHAPDALKPAWTEVAEADADLQEGAAALAEAEVALAANDHLAAWLAANRAIDEHGQAVGDVQELVAILDRLDAAKQEAAELEARLAAERGKIEQQLQSFGAAHGSGRLDAGDRALAELRAQAASGPIDWGARLLAVKSVAAAWHQGLAEAHASEARAQAEAARRTAEAQLREQAWAASHQSWSSSSSSSSSSSRSSYSTFSSGGSRSSHSSSSSFSSSRSSGSSFSSSSRSSGRSFSSGGGRSAGRKF